MKKRLGLFLAVVMVLNAIPATTFAWENPLKKYNLYDDVMGKNNPANAEREHAMSEFYDNSLDKKIKGSVKKTAREDYSSYNLDSFNNIEPEITKGRNETLRESSRDVYSDQETEPAWLEGPSFYPEPSFESIVEKYHRSDFAGCLQECISYVRKNPHDTLGYYYLAMAYTKCSDKDNAVRAYEKVIELNDNPMIVKYATNGRNCILDGEAPCYQNVNEPEYLRPYANLANINLQPIDPQTLIDRNLAALKDRLNPYEEEDNNDQNNNDEKDKKKEKINLPFGKQDADLDRFINAPYGNGLSPELNKQYKQLQLKKIQQSINKSEEESSDKKKENLLDIKKFDKQKSDSGSIKLAYEPSAADMESLMKDPEYIRQKQEFDELNMLLGNDKSKDNSDIMDLLPYMTEGDKKLSPEVIQSMMMKSMMGNITL